MANAPAKDDHEALDQLRVTLDEGQKVSAIDDQEIGILEPKSVGRAYLAVAPNSSPVPRTLRIACCPSNSAVIAILPAKTPMRLRAESPLWKST